MTLAPLDLTAVRSHFPALSQSSSEVLFADNAGGSQCLGDVVERLSEYMLHSNVQMADYEYAKTAARHVANGKAAAAAFVGTTKKANVMFGASATQLFETLSRMIEARVLPTRQESNDNAGAAAWRAGDEIVISQADHEANRGAWLRLAKRLQMQIVPWNVSKLSHGDAQDGSNVGLDIAELRKIVSDKTRLVAVTGSSNVLGSHWSNEELQEIVRTARSKSTNAYVVIDAVALAPHVRLRPEAWGVDAVLWSWYKVFGAHVGSMYVSDRMKDMLLTQLNHHFLHADRSTMYPYQPSSEQYELIVSIAATVDYLVALGKGKEGQKVERVDYADLDGDASKQIDQALDGAYARISQHESALAHTLLQGLRSLSDDTGYHIAIVGDPAPLMPASRAPTVAFYVKGDADKIASRKLHAKTVQRGKLGAQVGHMYAYDLINSLAPHGVDINDGVMRISFVHYNTLEEVKRTLTALKQAVSSS